jgi:hypothetical protein
VPFLARKFSAIAEKEDATALPHVLFMADEAK